MTEHPVITQEPRATKHGNIYIVDSPLVLAIKIGKSTHDTQSIARRYATSYGNHFSVYTFASDDIDTHEARVHESQSEYRICMELFEKHSLNESIAACEKICNSRREIYIHTARMVIRKGKKPNVDQVKITSAKATGEAARRARTAAILAAPDLDAGAIKAINDHAVKTIAERDALERHALRRAYKYESRPATETAIAPDLAPEDAVAAEILAADRAPGVAVAQTVVPELTEQFIATYDNDKARTIFANLHSVLRHMSWKDSIEDMRAATATVVDPLPNEYMRHYFARALIMICGFNDIVDESIITKEALETSLRTSLNPLLEADKDKIKAAKCGISSIFGKELRANASLKATLGFINGILGEMYGMGIHSLGSGHIKQNKFTIHHNYLKSLFPLLTDPDKPPSPDKPYILRGHGQDRIITGE